ncbi:MAG TPA: lipoyl(octanoyl) transferase LipB [Burkholderiaceae bacterium]|jgi:lipoyl(octanoyl) transferase|nr:lipoyl(octanoyl) transferase LipB [Burkholderiaceae bacterium]
MIQAEPIRRLLGRVPYVQTWHAMREFTLQRGAETADELWLVEHEPVYTLGQAGRREHLIAPGQTPVVATDRGGQVTYHGPGQAIVYTLIDLRRLGITVRELVFRIEQAVIQTLEPFGVVGRRVRGAPGIYVPYAGGARSGPFEGLAKIAALGVRIRNGCSYHGVALNCLMDLEPFAGIDPCGYPDLATVDLATLGVDLPWNEAAGRLSDRLAAHLTP